MEKVAYSQMTKVILNCVRNIGYGECSDTGRCVAPLAPDRVARLSSFSNGLVMNIKQLSDDYISVCD